MGGGENGLGEERMGWRRRKWVGGGWNGLEEEGMGLGRREWVGIGQHRAREKEERGGSMMVSKD